MIHSLGFYSFGIKIDAIPGRINLADTLRSLFKGEHRGFCFELCGQGHSSMLIVGLLLSGTEWNGVERSVLIRIKVKGIVAVSIRTRFHSLLSLLSIGC